MHTFNENLAIETETLPIEMLALLITFALTLLKSSGDVTCNKYEQCINTTIISNKYILCQGSNSCCGSIQTLNNSGDNGGINCEGNLACMKTSQYNTYTLDSTSSTTQITYTRNSNNPVYGTNSCNGYASCYKSTTHNIAQYIQCYATSSCSNVNISLQGDSPLFECFGLYSCTHSIFKSISSKEEVYFGYLNARTIYLHMYGCFDLYNSSIYSNGNDLSIVLYGYYSGYNLSIYCTQEQDNCNVYCVNNGCVNLMLFCFNSSNDNSNDDTNVVGSSCQIQCVDSNDDLCIESLDGSIDSSINKNNSLLYMLNDILSTYDKSYSISANNSNYIVIENDLCDVNISDYNKSRNVEGNYSNQTLCCNAYESCGFSTIDSSLNIFCNGKYSCYGSKFSNIQGNVYIKSHLSGWGTQIKSANIVTCEAMQSCLQAWFYNVNVLLCIGTYSCAQTHIINVDTVIVLGYGSLNYGTLTNVTNIYILGYDSTVQVSININSFESESAKNNCTIYCQYGACDGMNNDTLNKLYCSDYTNEYGIKITGLQKCSFNSQAPTTDPTTVPSTMTTTIPTRIPTTIPVAVTPPTGAAMITTINLSSSNSSSSYINNNTDDGGDIEPSLTPLGPFSQQVRHLIQFLQDATVIVSMTLAFIVVLLMIVSVYMRNENKHNQRLGMLTLTNDNYNNDSIIDSYDDNDDDDESMDMNINVNINIRKKSSMLTIVNYLSGFGKNASHFVIANLGLEIYDVFTDIAYLIELKYYKYNISFIIFLTSILITIICNGIIILRFLQYEFLYNGRFIKWFYEYNGIIMILIGICLLTDATMVCSLFTSQIFGHLIFYSPISLHGIDIMKISVIISIIVEHIPQLGVQIYVLFNKQYDFTNVMIGAFIVSIIDIVFSLFKAISWLVLYKTKSKKRASGHPDENKL